MPSPRPVPALLHRTAALVLLALAACSRTPPAETPPPPVMVVRPQPASAAFEVYAGEVRARREIALGFRVGGKITQRHVEIGDRVHAGQVLAELDAADLGRQVRAAEAAHLAAEAELELARSEFERHRSLRQRGLVSASLFEARKTAFEAARARVDQTRAQLELARSQSGYARLTASADGVIAERLAEAGQVVAAGQPVFMLAADGEREVAISLPEAGIERFRVGMPVLVNLWADPESRLSGTLRELAPAADPHARTYAARVRIDGDSTGVELGQSARAIFRHDQEGALTVPLPALTADGDRTQVWVVQPDTGQVSPREVRAGPFLDDRATVLSGLAASDWVVAAGVHLLRPGMKVRPVDRDNRPLDLTATR